MGREAQGSLVGPTMATSNDRAAEESYHIDRNSDVIPRKRFRDSISRKARGDDLSDGAGSSTGYKAKPPQSRQSNAPMKPVRCSLVPTCDCPDTDLATPTDGVDPAAAWRLWNDRLG